MLTLHNRHLLDGGFAVGKFSVIKSLQCLPDWLRDIIIANDVSGTLAGYRNPDFIDAGSVEQDSRRLIKIFDYFFHLTCYLFL